MSAAWFAARLRELREQAGLTQQQLGKSAGLKLGEIRDLEQERYQPTWGTVVALAKALGVDCNAFALEPEQPNREKPKPGRPRSILSRLSRKLLALDVKMKHSFDQDFTGVGDWYHSHAPEDKQRLRQDMQALAELTERVEMTWRMFVNVRFSFEQGDEEGNVTYSIGAVGAPRVWLQAIDLWDETGPLIADSAE
jgi:transcriptional regulator with XRE-family HTH domain